MKRLILAIILLTTTLTGCSMQKPVTSLLYNTTTLEDVKRSDGRQVTVTGYISMASPIDNTCAYLMSQPFNAEPTAHTSNTNVTDMIACYPPTGQYIKYTEECVAVTGTIKYSTMEQDAAGYTYPFYLVDCTYTTYGGTDVIAEYNYGITSGALVELDSWITSVYTSFAEPSTAAAIDIKTNRDAFDTKLGDRECPSMVALVEKVEDLTEVYNTWVKTSPTEVSDELMKSYVGVGTQLQEWLTTLTVKGDEVQ